MGGRREASNVSHGPVTSNDMKHKRLSFCESVSTFLQLVVAYSSRFIFVATAATKGLTMSTGLGED